MLRFVLGGPTHDHFGFCVTDINEQLKQVENSQIYFLVPDHMKFDAEKELLKGLKQKSELQSTMYGHLNVGVYSFSRLAWALLKDSGVLSKPHLSSVGQEMMVRYLLMTHESQLVYYKLESRKVGFIEQLSALFNEFRRGNVQVKALEDFVAQYETDDISQKARVAKIKEIQMLYAAYDKTLSGQYSDTETLYHHLIMYIQTHDLSQVTIYLHGYERFNAIELQIVQALIQSCRQVIVTLPLPKEKIETPRFDALAYIPQHTYSQLLQFAKTNRIPVAFDSVAPNRIKQYSTGMQNLLNFWEKTFSNEIVEQEILKQDDVAVKTFATKYEEVEAVVKLIQYYVHEKGYRYQDFYVLMRQVEDYETLIEPLFQESNIPLFFDNAMPMSDHPLIELIASLEGVQKRYYQYNDMMRLLKTQLLLFAPIDAVDLLENEILANGYSGSWWFKEDAWENDDLRHQIVECLQTYFERLNNCQTMKDAASVLYSFLIEQHIPETLLAWRDQYVSSGTLDKGKIQEQAWSTFVNLLDEFVMILGDQPFDKAVFYQVLITGFEQFEFNLVPASLDQVSVSSLDAKRLLPKKMVFIIGAQATQFPKMYDNNGLLNNVDVQALQTYLPEQSYLDLSTAFRTRVEPFVVLNVWVSALEKVFIFNTVGSSESTYIQLLKRYFVMDDLKLDDIYGVGKMAVRQLIHQERHSLETGTPLSLRAKTIHQELQNVPLLQQWYQFLQSSLTYNNLPTQLTNAKELYQGQLHLSISQLESYFNDPFSHFLRYGLKLKERQTLELTAANIGNVFHSVLDGLHKQLFVQNRQLSTLSMDEVIQLTNQHLQQTFDLPQNKVFERTKSMQFSKRLIEETLLQTMLELHQQDRLVHIHPIATEQRFSAVEQKDNLIIPSVSIDSQHQLYLRGIIDRIDTNDNYFSVVDYKSSERQFKLQQFYEGVSLQLMMYLYVSTQLFKQDKQPLGAFYREINFEYQLRDKEDEERAFIKQKGIITAPSGVLSTIDPTGQVYQARIAKSGEYVKNQSHIFNTDDLPMLFDYLLLKVKEAGKRILAGDISLEPLEDNAYIPSLNEYRSISLFDATNPTNRYRRFEKVENFLETIKQKVGEQDA